MDIGKWKILAVSMTLICCLAIPVLAYEYFFRTDNRSFRGGVTLIAYPGQEMQLGFYWDAACTQRIDNMSRIDFGELIHPNTPTTLTKVIYIRNEGNAWNVIYWSTTISSATTQITDDWTRSPSWVNMNGTTLDAGSVIETHYIIHIPAYATVGAYEWWVAVWGEHWY